MRHSEAFFITLLTALLLAVLSSVHADQSCSQEKQTETRRAEHLKWIVKHFGNLEPAVDPRDGRRWALNHPRLVL